MATAAAPNPKPPIDDVPRPRRWIPLSLRMFVALLGILGAIAIWKGARIYRQHVAAESIMQMDGNVSIDSDPLKPLWYKKWLTDDLVYLLSDVDVIDVSKVPQFTNADFGAFPNLTWPLLSSTRITDAGMADLTGLVHLEALFLRDTEVSDRGLFCLRRMSDLQQLDLHGTKVTVAGFASLGALMRLERLDLSDAPFTDEGLAQIAKFSNLKILDLSRTSVSDAGIRHLKPLLQLQELTLDNTRLTDAGLLHLEGLVNLRKLSIDNTDVTYRGEPTMTLFDDVRTVDLRFCEGVELDSIDFACFGRLRVLLLGVTEIGDEDVLQLKAPADLRFLSLWGLDRVTDRGLARLQTLPKLENLELNDTSITDAGLEHLKALTHLRTLVLDRTNVSSDAIADLKATLPDLVVSKDGEDR